MTLENLNINTLLIELFVSTILISKFRNLQKMKLIKFQNNSFILINLKNSLERNHVHCAYLNSSIHKMQSKEK